LVSSVRLKGRCHLDQSPAMSNLVAAPLFNLLLRLEENRALRLQYCFSVVSLLIEGDPPLSSEQVSRLTQLCASLTTNLLRSTDLVTLLAQGGIGVLLVDADASATPEIVRRMTDVFDAWVEGEGPSKRRVKWSAGAASYPQHASRGHALLEQAEILMCQARADGGNRLHLPVA
jgi:hypothetical protein